MHYFYARQVTTIFIIILTVDWDFLGPHAVEALGARLLDDSPLVLTFFYIEFMVKSLLVLVTYRISIPRLDCRYILDAF